MATGSRTLTLKLLADIDNFQKNLKQADNDTSGFSKQVEKFGAAAKAAFAAAAAAAAAYAASAAVQLAVNFALSYVVTRIFGSQPPNQNDPGVRQQIPPNSTKCADPPF